VLLESLLYSVQQLELLVQEYRVTSVDTEFVKVQSASKDKKPHLSAAVLVVEL
jgi:hypothetical protein